MTASTDIRDLSCIDHDDVTALNFIRSDPPYRFRRYFRHGLRSHILQVLAVADVEAEKHGTKINGVRTFPRAVPTRMLRLFRRRFADIEEVLDENRRLRIVEAHLPSDQLARSDEFIVEYCRPDGSDILLCGLQEYVAGRPLDPWQIENALAWSNTADIAFISRLMANAGRFVDSNRRLILSAGLVPDLAGARNIIVTSQANLCLVDINNVTEVHFDNRIHLDDKDYPACDKSIEALWRLEHNLLGRAVAVDDPIYACFIQPARMAEADRLHRRFHRALEEKHA